MEYKIRTPYGKATVYSITPPGAIQCVMVIPGYSESLAHTKALVDSLGEQGVAAFSFSQPRKSVGSEEDSLVRLADIMLQVNTAMSPNDGTKIFAAAHSLGAPALLKAAHQKPSAFTGLLLIDPTGLDTTLSIPTLMGGVIKKTLRNQLSTLRGRGGDATHTRGETPTRYFARVARAQLTSVGVVLRNPTLSAKEAKVAMSCCISEDITKVAALNIPISLITTHGNELFNVKRVSKTYAGISNHLSSGCSFADKTAGHDAFWMQPDKTTGLIVHLID